VPDSDHDEAVWARSRRCFISPGQHWLLQRKSQCRALVAYLKDQGFSALALFGELELSVTRCWCSSNRSCSVLVATDVAARRLDIAQLAMVVWM
jgi:ATP-independent RNA helicase DbpA